MAAFVIVGGLRHRFTFLLDVAWLKFFYTPYVVVCPVTMGYRACILLACVLVKKKRGKEPN